MKINPNKCVACGNCVYVCPVGAIYVDPAIKRATIDRNECVQCYACYNGLSPEHLNPVLVRTVRKLFQLVRLRFDPEPDICPTAAFEPDDLQWPRVVRRAFSDPRATHESTGVQGRGTEEVKTNDVTHRVSHGEVGFTIEFGRPGVGVWFRDIQKMTQALASVERSFREKKSSYSTDRATLPPGLCVKTSSTRRSFRRSSRLRCRFIGPKRSSSSYTRSRKKLIVWLLLA